MLKNKNTGVKTAAANGISEKAMWIFTGLLTVLYYSYSFLSTGFYQHDEVGHYFSMLGFWNNPNSILGNWAKPGYKLIFAAPALLGIQFLFFLNSFISALTCFIAYKIAKELKSRYAVLAFFLLALQPFWIQLSFRNYADSFSGFLLALFALMHCKGKLTSSTLILSYAAFVRQEFYLLLVVYGIYLLLNKKILHALLLGIFPLLNNLWGWAVSGDMLYLYTSSMETSSRYATEYPRQGFDHYFLMSITVFGSASVLLFIAYTFQQLFYMLSKLSSNKKKMVVTTPTNGSTANLMLLFVLVYFLAQAIFSAESLNIGPSNAGNLRYMLPISPFVAVLGALALDKMTLSNFKGEKIILYVILFIFAAVVGVAMTYKHNNIKFTEEKDMLPLIFTIICIAGLILPLKESRKILYMVVVSVLFVLMEVRPMKVRPEEVAIEKTVNILGKRNYFEKRTCLYNHSIFKYYCDKNNYPMDDNAMIMDSISISKAPKNSLLIWDTHYSYRPKLNKRAVNYNYFSDKTKFLQIVSTTSSDNKFQIFAFEKL